MRLKQIQINLARGTSAFCAIALTLLLNSCADSSSKAKDRTQGKKDPANETPASTADTSEQKNDADGIREIPVFDRDSPDEVDQDVTIEPDIQGPSNKPVVEKSSSPNPKPAAKKGGEKKALDNKPDSSVVVSTTSTKRDQYLEALTKAIPANSSLAITQIEVNQGVGFNLYDSSNASGQAENFELVARRDTLVRVGIKSDQASGSFFVVLGIATSATAEALAQAKFFESDEYKGAVTSNFNTLASTVNFQIKGEDLLEDSQMFIIILNLDDAASRDAPKPLLKFPASTGSNVALLKLPIANLKTEMKVVLVPMDTPKGKFAAKLGDDAKQNYKNWLYNTLPVSNVEVEFLSTPLEISNLCDPNGDSLKKLRELRAKEKRGPEWFYQGMVTYQNNPCGRMGGYALLLSPGLNEPRVGWFTWGGAHGGDISAHELGHNLGRLHSFDDRNYLPKELNKCGGRSHFGFALRPTLDPANRKSIHNQLFALSQSCTDNARHDYMSYSQNFWVSGYTFTKTHEYLKTLSKNLQGRAALVGSGSLSLAGSTKTRYELTGYFDGETINFEEKELVFINEGSEVEWDNKTRLTVSILDNNGTLGDAKVLERVSAIMGADNHLVGVKFDWEALKSFSGHDIVIVLANGRTVAGKVP